MLSALAALAVLLAPVAGLVALMMALEARQRARDAAAARQIQLTDAIHAELGAVVAPVVEKRAFQPWRVVFAVSEPRRRDVGRLLEITDRVLGNQLHDVQIVFRRPLAA
ncbi:MAG: hypothetical protein FJZ38_19065 [Candidatus Rokubacteria bacterium]|nr:hypothetical protein [Candidatus Rokubacteria bacterium]